MLSLSAPSLDATEEIAAALAGVARPGDMIVLAGEMGAGKTAFARSFGAALGVTEAITSPTFTLVHSYPVDDRVTLHHADLYRLDHTSDVEDLALHELAEFGGIVLIEWGDVVDDRLGDLLEVRLAPVDAIDVDDGDDEDDGGRADEFGLDGSRSITVTAVGQRWAGRWDRLVAVLSPWRVRP